MHIPVHSPWLPGYIDVAQTILILIVVGPFPAPRISFQYVINIKVMRYFTLFFHTKSLKSDLSLYSTSPYRLVTFQVLNSHMCLAATVIDSADIEYSPHCKKLSSVSLQ